MIPHWRHRFGPWATFQYLTGHLSLRPDGMLMAKTWDEERRTCDCGLTEVGHGAPGPSYPTGIQADLSGIPSSVARRP